MLGSASYRISMGRLFSMQWPTCPARSSRYSAQIENKKKHRRSEVRTRQGQGRGRGCGLWQSKRRNGGSDRGRGGRGGGLLVCIKIS